MELEEILEDLSLECRLSCKRLYMLSLSQLFRVELLVNPTKNMSKIRKSNLRSNINNKLHSTDSQKTFREKTPLTTSHREDSQM
jgi:hypothetical protein